MYRNRLLSLALIVGLGLFFRTATAQTGSQPQQDPHDPSAMHNMEMGERHYDQVNKRGDVAMGFSHMKTRHHFRLSPSGGSIEVQADDPNDTASRDQIRRHLEQLPQAFKEGNFSAPMETHGRVPPGVPTMQQLRSQINYQYVQTKRGGKVLISTADPKALEAVHQFLRFQIQDHRTGDPANITK